MLRWLAMVLAVGLVGCAVPDLTDNGVLRGDESFQPAERAAIERAVDDACADGGDCMQVSWECEAPCRPMFGDRVVINGMGSGAEPQHAVPGTWWIWIRVPTRDPAEVYWRTRRSLAHREES